MLLKIDRFSEEYYVSFIGINRLNLHNAEAVKKELLPLIVSSNKSVSIDFSGIKFIDSSGFQVLVAILKTAELYNSKLEVMNISEDLKELFDLLSLSDVFQITAN